MSSNNDITEQEFQKIEERNPRDRWWSESWIFNKEINGKQVGELLKKIRKKNDWIEQEMAPVYEETRDLPENEAGNIRGKKLGTFFSDAANEIQELSQEMQRENALERSQMPDPEHVRTARTDEEIIRQAQADFAAQEREAGRNPRLSEIQQAGFEALREEGYPTTKEKGDLSHEFRQSHAEGQRGYHEGQLEAELTSLIRDNPEMARDILETYEKERGGKDDRELSEDDLARQTSAEQIREEKELAFTPANDNRKDWDRER